MRTACVYELHFIQTDVFRSTVTCLQWYIFYTINGLPHQATGGKKVPIDEYLWVLDFWPVRLATVFRGQFYDKNVLTAAGGVRTRLPRDNVFNIINIVRPFIRLFANTNYEEGIQCVRSPPLVRLESFFVIINNICFLSCT